MQKKITHIVGIDEAGRGPLAGPVAVGIVVIPRIFDWRLVDGVTDSKLLSEKKREELFKAAWELRKGEVLDYRVSMVGANVIDRVGIAHAVATATARGVTSLGLKPEAVYIKLDGLLSAPSKFLYQKTIIKGDRREREIALASILAKVTRDEYMKKAATKYPEYNFGAHKGYGTKEHVSLIHRNGLSVLHRKSYCKNLIQ